MTKVLGNDACMIVYVRSSQLLWMDRQVDGQESNQSVATALPWSSPIPPMLSSYL
jgi:hypothetical protein